MQLIAWLPLLAVLICPIVMGIMMWKMNKNMDDRHMDMKSDTQVHHALQNKNDERISEAPNAEKAFPPKS